MIWRFRLYFILIFISLSIPFLTGCASIVSDSTYPVRFQSSSNSDVIVKNQMGQTFYKGSTPTVINLPASEGFFQPAHYTAKFSNNGSTNTQPLNATLDGWYIGNILFGGLIGFLIVDPATGAMWKLNGPVTANLDSND